MSACSQPSVVSTIFMVLKLEVSASLLRMYSCEELERDRRLKISEPQGSDVTTVRILTFYVVKNENAAKLTR